MIANGNYILQLYDPPGLEGAFASPWRTKNDCPGVVQGEDGWHDLDAILRLRGELPQPFVTNPPPPHEPPLKKSRRFWYTTGHNLLPFSYTCEALSCLLLELYFQPLPMLLRYTAEIPSHPNPWSINFNARMEGRKLRTIRIVRILSHVDCPCGVFS